MSTSKAATSRAASVGMGGDTVLGRLALIPAMVQAPRPAGLRRLVGGYMATSPGRLVRTLLVLAGLAAVVGVVQVEVISHVRSAVETIGVSTRPSIVAAEKAAATLATMDAEVTNDVLLGGLSSAGSGASFQAGVARMSRLLIDASRNVTYESTEVPAIDELQRHLSWYYGTLGEVRAMAGDSPWTAQQRLKWASRINREFASLSVAALGEANDKPMSDAYKAYDRSYLLYGAMGIGAGVVLVLAMLASQATLARRTNRMLNAPMALATVVVILAQAFFFYSIVAEHWSIRTAKLDAFDSVAALYRAKASALRANSDESMWLLDKDTRASTEASFRSLATAVLGSAGGNALQAKGTIAGMDAALRLEREGKARAALDAMPRIQGFLGNAASNVTFGTDEREPLTAAVEAFMRYVRIDGLIRRLETAGYHNEAVRLTVGVRPGAADWASSWDDAAFDAALRSRDTAAIDRILHVTGDSDWAFSRFEAALDRAIEVNDGVFDRQIGKALRLLSIMLPLALASLLGACVLAAAGLWQRYQEYR